MFGAVEECSRTNGSEQLSQLICSFLLVTCSSFYLHSWNGTPCLLSKQTLVEQDGTQQTEGMWPGGREIIPASSSFQTTVKYKLGNRSQGQIIFDVWAEERPQSYQHVRFFFSEE